MKQANANVADLAKRLKHAEGANIELSRRVDELNSALQGASGDNQRLQAELARLRVQISEVQDKHDALARENKQLTGRPCSYHSKCCLFFARAYVC
jgi:chromosome segregation ATPase